MGINGIQKTNHWIVCAGLEVLSNLLASYQEACEAAHLQIAQGHSLVSIQHVGTTTEPERLRDPYYRMGDPFVNPNDRNGM
jgi:hypothetical protein